MKGRVRAQLVIAVAVLAVVAAIVGRAVATSGGAAPAASAKTSPCGQVGEPARRLGVEATRELTLCLLNRERAAHGLAPLREEPRLELASQRHSNDMVARGFFEHETPEGVDPYERIGATGYPVNNATTGENIAWGASAEGSPAEIFDAWMHSRGHRENILRPAFSEVGVGVAFGAPRAGSDGSAATYTTDFGGPPY